MTAEENFVKIADGFTVVSGAHHAIWHWMMKAMTMVKTIAKLSLLGPELGSD